MDQQIIISSYHEAGHALMAYIVGWTIDSVVLKIDDEKLIYAVTKYDFLEDDENNWTNIQRRIYCLLGGPLSQALYEKVDSINLDTLGRDGETIDNSLSGMGSSEKETILQESINSTATLLKTYNHAIQYIADKLIVNHQMSRDEFEDFVKSSGVKQMKFD